MAKPIAFVWIAAAICWGDYALAQEDVFEADTTQITAPTKEDSTQPTAESLYESTFKTGDVVPKTPAEGEPDTTGVEPLNPEKGPISNDNYDPDDSYSEAPVRFGFTGALEIPHIINVGVDSLIYRKYGLSINYGNVSRNINGVDVGMKHTDLRFRFHPFGGSFFGGVAVGQHTLIGEKKRDITLTVNSQPVTVPAALKLTAKANYVAPHIGWFTIWGPGFTMGLDIGWLVPSGATAKSEATFANLPPGEEQAARNSPEFIKTQADLEDSAEAYAKKSMPFVTMLRVGWMF